MLGGRQKQKSYADQHATLLFSGLKSVYGPSSSILTSVRADDGTLPTDKGQILERCTVHFSQLLSRPSTIDEQALQDMPQRPLIPTLDGELPQDFKDANIIHLYKNNGGKAACDNHRGISLLSIAGKILAPMLLNRITEYQVDRVVSESQCGFRQNRGTIDMVFAIRQLQEKCIEQRQDLYLLFIDLTKAFDTVSRPGLWSILSRLPPKVRQSCTVIDVSEPFPVTNGVKQSCILAPTLFSLLFAEMLSAALTQIDTGIKIRYRMDGRFFYLRRLKAHTKVREALLRSLAAIKNVEDFTYLGSCVSSSGTLDQEISCQLAKASGSFGRLWTRVWLERTITLGTKVAVYRAVVLSSLLCGCYRRHVKKLDQFHLHCLRTLLGIHWEDRVTNQEVLWRAALPGIEALIIQAQLRWSGHVMRMEDSHLPKQLFCSELSRGSRKQGGQIKRYKDSLKQSLRACNIPITAWRQSTLSGFKAFEERRLEQFDAKRHAKKDKNQPRYCRRLLGVRTNLRIRIQYTLNNLVKSWGSSELPEPSRRLAEVHQRKRMILQLRAELMGVGVFVDLFYGGEERVAKFTPPN
ncbi:uncharacterized protein LOC134771946 [Penaeus indicus]|uniref:uncharacterized protein LOC134771946 n=1 Tax=Penaeus indicus TaxID=29960 RepID=UPI00300C54A3